MVHRLHKWETGRWDKGLRIILVSGRERLGTYSNLDRDVAYVSESRERWDTGFRNVGEVKDWAQASTLWEIMEKQCS